MVQTIAEQANRILAYIQASVIAPIGDPRDTIDYLFRAWDHPSGSTMPASPGVAGYILSVSYDHEADVLSYSIDYEFREITKWLLKQLPREQIYHRSRAESIAFSPLRIPEQEKKVRQIGEWKDSMLTHAVSDSTSLQLYTMFCDTIAKYLEFDWAYVKHYISEHKSRSIGGHFKWHATESLSESQWRTIFSSVRIMWDNISAHPGKGIDLLWNTGMRARADALDGVSGHQYGKVDRTRIVQFHPCLSIQNIFLPRKKEAIKYMLDETIKIVHAGGDHKFALVEGGQIYQSFSDEVQKDGLYIAADGKNWEASLGLLLGPAFSTLMYQSGGFSFLPSGAFYTTMLGTMGSIIQCRYDEGVKFLHGDDQGVFNPTWTKKVPWVETDEGDTKLKLFLGASFAYDPNAPRIVGIKIMSDRPEKMIPIHLSGVDNTWEDKIGGKNSYEEIAAWAGLYQGFYGDKTLLDALKEEHIENYDYISPTRIYNSLIDRNARGEALAWAEREGIKNLIFR